MNLKLIVKSKPGFTLVEMMIAIMGSTMILASLSSTLYIALKASDTSLTPAQHLINEAQFFNDLQLDLQYTISMSEMGSTALTASIPDRDNDTNYETVRIAWSGVTGDPITRQYNGGTVNTILENVHYFNIQYIQANSMIDFINLELQVSNQSEVKMETSIGLVNEVPSS